MPLLTKHFTVFSFDLFFHGESRWNEPGEPTRNDMAELFSGVMQAEQVNRFSLMGYSMGGRWSTTLLHLFPDKIENMYLVAADGLWTNPLFLNLTSMRPDNPLVRFIISRSAWLFTILSVMRKAGWVDRASYYFFIEKVNTKEKRSLLLRRWRSQKYMTVKPAEIALLMQRNNIQVHLFYGTLDYLIPLKEARRFGKLAQKAIIHEINDGHMLIIGLEFYNVLEEILNTPQ